MSRNSKSDQRKSEQLRNISVMIEKKKIEISKKNQAKELLEKYKSQAKKR